MSGFKNPNNTGAVVGGFKAKPNLTERRQQMKYKVSTSSTTARGVLPIKGATKYPEEPTIHFTREAWVKQCHLVTKCDKEVGWFALVDYDEPANTFTITEIVIPNQEVTAAETNIGKEDLADAAMILIEAGKNTSKMYAWFHSHVNMGVSPSAQDEYQVEEFLEDLADQPEVPAFIRGIQNKKGDLKLDVYYVQHGVAYQNVDFYVIHDDDPQWFTDIEKEVKDKVNERTYQYSQYSSGGFGGNHQQAGKSQNASARSAAIKDAYDDYYDGFRKTSHWNTWDYRYDEEDDSYLPAGPVASSVEHDDSPDTAKRMIDYEDISYMDVVYHSDREQLDVLQDDDGTLWVCDVYGAIYSYEEYTELYGEIDNPKKLPAVQ